MLQLATRTKRNSLRDQRLVVRADAGRLLLRGGPEALHRAAGAGSCGALPALILMVIDNPGNLWRPHRRNP
jgi:hypothetical protein